MWSRQRKASWLGWYCLTHQIMAKSFELHDLTDVGSFAHFLVGRDGHGSELPLDGRWSQERAFGSRWWVLLHVIMRKRQRSTQYLCNSCIISVNYYHAYMQKLNRPSHRSRWMYMHESFDESHRPSYIITRSKWKLNHLSYCSHWMNMQMSVVVCNYKKQRGTQY
jgi:hypothetical protein